MNDRKVGCARRGPRGIRMLRLLPAAMLVLAGCGATGARVECAGQKPALSAAAWIHHSAEHDAATASVFRAATRALPKLLARAGSAAVEQDVANPEALSELPPAVVVDIDETLLDNGPYLWELASTGQSHDEASWDRWVARQEAEAIPGALEYVRAARELDVKVIYVTNRACRGRGSKDPCPQRRDTRINLERAGFPPPGDGDLLLRGAKPEWSSDKSSRRAHVASRYRIIQLVGDALGDFMPGAGKRSAEERQEQVEKYRARWGDSWLALPNPVYGSWLAHVPEPETCVEAGERDE